MDPNWIWTGPDIPANKPAFRSLLPDHSDRVWVIRHGPGFRDPDCKEPADPEEPQDCWDEARIIDVFGEDCRYLGEVDVPAEFELSPWPIIVGDELTAVVEDELGTIRVRRYRLAPPTGQ